MLMSVFNLLADTASDIKALQDQVKLDSQILAEHVLLLDRRRDVADPRRLHGVRGRRGAAQERDVDGDEEHPHDRRRDADLLLLRLVRLRLHGGRLAEERSREPRRVPRLLRPDGTVERGDAARTCTDHISGVFFLAFLLFSWTTGSIMSGALIERIRLSAYLILTALLGSFVWILDAAWGWSAGGWLTTRFGFHDAIASGVVHGVAGIFTLGVLINLGPRIGKYDIKGRARTFRGHNQHLTLLGLMLIFTGFYGFYAACLVIQSTVFPGWLNIYLSPTTLGAIAMVITIGFAGGFTGGWFASKGDPFWTLSGGLAGVIAVSAGADVYHPSLAYLLSFSGAIVAVWAGKFIEERLRLDDAVGAVAVHGVCGFYGVLLVGIFAGGYPTGINNIETSLGGQLIGIMTFIPLAFLPGYFASLALKKLNLLRVPPEVELEGLDMAEFHQDFFPEFEPVPERIVSPDGEIEDAVPILIDAYDRSSYGKAPVGVGAES